MLIAFCVQPPAIFLHSGGKFPSCSKRAVQVVKQTFCKQVLDPKPKIEKLGRLKATKLCVLRSRYPQKAQVERDNRLCHLDKFIDTSFGEQQVGPAALDPRTVSQSRYPKRRRNH